MRGKARRFGLDQRVAPSSRLDRASFGKNLRPRLAGDLQEFERELPITIERLRHQPIEPLPGHAARRHVVHQAREVVRERQRGSGIVGNQWRLALLVGGDALRPFEHEAREQQAPLEPAERRRQLERLAG